MEHHRLLVDLHIAIDLNDTMNICEILSKDKNWLNQPDRNLFLELLLLKTISCKNKEVTQLLFNFFEFIELGADIDFGKLLEVSIIKENVEMIKFLLKSGMKLEDSKWNRKSAIHHTFSIANIEARKEILTLLIQHGLNTKVPNAQGHNLLHEFIYHYMEEDDCRAVEIVRILLCSGISINEKDDKGFTVLHYSLLKPNFPIIRLLVKEGADVNAKSEKDGLFPLYITVYHNNVDILNLLISNGADVNSMTFYGRTALHRACCYNREKAISVLIQKNACISVENSRKDTPFMQLEPSNKNYLRCVYVMVKEFAKLTYENLLDSKTDLNQIKRIPDAQAYFEGCVSELNVMASLKFYDSYSYYSVLKMKNNIKKLAHLTNNEEFVSSFNENLSQFSNYKKDLQRILKEATKIKDDLMTVDLRLHSTFGDVLPSVVLTNMAKYLTVEDLPLDQPNI